MQLGCHISVAKGFSKACQRAGELGAESFQVFTKNPRGLRPKKLNYKDAEKGVQLMKEQGITLVAHTPYITNLSTPKADLHEVTVRSIKEDLHIADTYGAVGAVVHCGKHVGEGVEAGTERMVDTLNEILADYEGNCRLLLENTAGQGSELGLAIEDLVQIREATDYPEKIGFCFDTCHGFAAGAWNGDTFDELVTRMLETGYREHLVAIHLNDSKAPYNSRKDRHEKIGQGEIGAPALAQFLRSEVFEGLSVVLETPVEQEDEYAEEIRYLHQLKEEKPAD
ncbi:Endonuclease IV [Melghirimyces thermohalophilus]|uniref:Probable endonuclease 4 n=1 Tax=Melghirimyces thermohalophilus TaxID=1236220 RepID=A0A1G6HPP2_9BACL|nr:deoxyribonuclease IV [Melghirimyces thermohalophilus]SDB96108.1 Endonuclease IV [Melghirimyces thermohalophilus]